MGVYDQNCDASQQDIFICKKGIELQSSHQSCVYEKGDVALVPHVRWEQYESVYCDQSYPKVAIETKSEAIDTCAKDGECFGIYEEQCDLTNGRFFLCKFGSNLISSPRKS